MEMKITAIIVLMCGLWEAQSYPYNYYPAYYGTNMDTLSMGASGSTRGGMVMSRYYNPYYTPYGGGMAAVMYRQPEPAQPSSQNQYYTAKQETYVPPPQENEVFYPQSQFQDKATFTTEAELTDFTTEKSLDVTTSKSVIPLVPVVPVPVEPEITEPEVEEVEQERKPRRRVSKKKPVKKPVEEEDDEDEEYPQMPTGAFFPMFFGYGRSQGMSPGGATAIANAYSTGKGGVATSHATAFGNPETEFRSPQPDYRQFPKTPEPKKYRDTNVRYQ